MNGRITTARGTYVSSVNQGRPVSVKHDARCVMGKVGEDKNPKGGILIYCYKFAVIS